MTLEERATRILYCDRSRAQLFRRCPRARYWEYESVEGKGIVPRRKNIALVIGLAFHAGAEVLLTRAMNGADFSQDEVLRDAENNAVQAGLLELAKWTAAGVEVDLQEQPEKRDGTTISNNISDISVGCVGDISAATTAKRQVRDQQTREQADSPIVIDFGDAQYVDLKVDLSSVVISLPKPMQPSDMVEVLGVKDMTNFGDPIYPSSSSNPTSFASAAVDSEAAALAEIEIHDAANESAATGVDDYLRVELAALVEGMIRAYARRRLKPLLVEFEVLEVEREGSWKLGEHGSRDWRCSGENVYCEYCHEEIPDLMEPPLCPAMFELFWMSRHDGLLLERQSNSLYLLSFKTTGAWDRRKKADAEIDMQGLSEAVDVEKRLAEAWEILQEWIELNGPANIHRVLESTPLASLVSERIGVWLVQQPAPPKILGVRYEYILKGARRREDKQASARGEVKRWVQDSPLVRAYLSRGITSEDDRWAPKYEWSDITGKEKRIDYRSWKKQAVWESMPIAAWIDRLDRGDFWPGEDGFDAAGNPMDVLADQFVEPVVVYRSEDDMRDWLQQVEAQEVGVALAVEEVRRAEKEGEGAKRSALNRLFAQNRSACSYPSLCQFRPVCYGGEDIRRDPLNNSDLYAIRQANHPIEMGGE